LPSDRLFGPSLTTPRMAEAVGDDAWLAAILRFEAALASAQSRAGLIPADAAAAIRAACDPARFDLAAIGRDAVASATPVVPVVDALRRAVGDRAAEFVHRGATSQDAIDTAMMLVARDGLDLLIADLSEVASRCAALARRYRDTPMAGRTLLVQARPITFGLKAATWLVGIIDCRARLAEIRGRRLTLQLGGAVGTLDAFGPSGAQLVADIASELGLAVPEPLPWHTDRGRVAELGAALAIAAGAAAKIALDVILLSQTEVGEVAEVSPGRSSAMPEKRNPSHAVLARAAFAGVVAQAGVLLTAMVGEHERSAGAWQSEWPALSEAFRLAAGAVARTREALTDLSVNEERMRANLGSAQTKAPESAGPLVDRALAFYRLQEEKR
jgi:3-carboxy-cis,cis-muconate cycloisomerase